MSLKNLMFNIYNLIFDIHYAFYRRELQAPPNHATTFAFRWKRLLNYAPGRVRNPCHTSMVFQTWNIFYENRQCDFSKISIVFMAPLKSKTQG